MSDAAAQRQDRPAAGVFWMLVTGLCFVAVTALVKHGARDLPAAEAAFLRFALGILFFLPFLAQILRLRLTPRQWKIFGFRSVAHTFAVLLWFYAMTRITIAEVTAMNYLAPVYVTIGAALFLGERLAIRRIAAIAAAFIGALIILRPGFRELSDGHMAMLGTALFFAISYLTAKRMTDELPATVIVGILSVTVTIGLLPFALAVWQTPTLEDLFWMFLVALFATGGHYAMTLAFAAAPVTVTQPVTFLQLVWATLLGSLVFGEGVDIWVVIGGTVIIAAVTFIAIREAMLKVREKGGAAPGP